MIHWIVLGMAIEACLLLLALGLCGAAAGGGADPHRREGTRPGSSP